MQSQANEKTTKNRKGERRRKSERKRGAVQKWRWAKWNICLARQLVHGYVRAICAVASLLSSYAKLITWNCMHFTRNYINFKVLETTLSCQPPSWPHSPLFTLQSTLSTLQSTLAVRLDSRRLFLEQSKTSWNATKTNAETFILLLLLIP